MASENIHSVRNRKPPSKAENAGAPRATPKGQKFKLRSQQIPLGNLFKSQRYWARFVIIFAVIVIIYVGSLNVKDKKFARQREVLPFRFQPLRCQAKGEPITGCTPKTCGRYVSDNLITDEEQQMLMSLAKSAFVLSPFEEIESATFDLTSGFLSNGKSIQDIRERDTVGYSKVFSHEHLLAIKLVKSKIIQSLRERFDIQRIHLASPILFSRLTNTSNLDYSRHQIVRDLLPSVFYTTIVHLQDFGKQFQGGRHIFIDDSPTNKTITSVESRTGRLTSFTSGPENIHYTEPVTVGWQYRVTMHFTCDESQAVAVPEL